LGTLFLPSDLRSSTMADMTPDSDETDRRIRQVTKILMEARCLTRLLVARGTGIGTVTLDRRLAGASKGGRWSALELAMLSAYFEVPAQVFLDGPSALLTGPRDRNG